MSKFYKDIQSGVANIIANFDKNVKEKLIRYSSSYASSQTQPRSTLTRYSHMLFDLAFGHDFNPKGSYLDNKVLRDLSVNIKIGSENSILEYHAEGKLAEIEHGDLDFSDVGNLLHDIRKYISPAIFKENRKIIYALRRAREPDFTSPRPYLLISFEESVQEAKKQMLDLFTSHSALRRLN